MYSRPESEKLHRHMMEQRGSDEWRREAIYSRTESEKLRVKVREKKERRERCRC